MTIARQQIIYPYRGLKSVPFGSRSSIALAAFGPPTLDWKTSSGERELTYPGVIFRYSSDHEVLDEISVVPGGDVAFLIDSTPISWDAGFLDEMVSADGDPYWCVGFTVLLRLGLALSGFDPIERSQQAVSAFRRGLWDDMVCRGIPKVE